MRARSVRACVPEQTRTRRGAAATDRQSGRQSGRQRSLCEHLGLLLRANPQTKPEVLLLLPRLLSDMPRTARPSPGFTLDLALNRLWDLTKETEDARM